MVWAVPAAQAWPASPRLDGGLCRRRSEHVDISHLWSSERNRRRTLRGGEHRWNRPVMTSPDGVTRTPQSTGVSNSRWYAVTYGEDGSGNGMFVAVSVINQGGTPR